MESKINTPTSANRDKKGLLQDVPVMAQILLLLVIVGFFMAATNMFSVALVSVQVGFSTEALDAILVNINQYPDILRQMAFLQDVLLFIFPALLAAWLFSGNYREYLSADNPVYLPVARWAIVGTIVFIPFSNLTYSFNQQMVLPDFLKGVETWMRASEDLAAKQIEAMLNTDNTSAFLMNVMIVCVFTAIGEELMFRGVLQRLLGRVYKNPHVVIWLVAFLFSAIHLQFYGFVPRLLIGAYLGYLLYYTKTIWVPVLAHFTNNFFGVSVAYFFHDSPEKLDQIDKIGTGTNVLPAAVSLLLFLYCYRKVKKRAAIG